ncbi:hypothetical protein ACOME3_001597 [Neoechinorhynchus agilis]
MIGNRWKSTVVQIAVAVDELVAQVGRRRSNSRDRLQRNEASSKRKSLDSMRNDVNLKIDSKHGDLTEFCKKVLTTCTIPMAALCEDTVNSLRNIIGSEDLDADDVILSGNRAMQKLSLDEILTAIDNLDDF